MGSQMAVLCPCSTHPHFRCILGQHKRLLLWDMLTGSKDSKGISTMEWKDGANRVGKTGV